MPAHITFSLPGNLGNVAGAESDGVLIGAISATDPAKVLTKSKVNRGLAFQEDGNAYTDFTTELNEATADDVDLLPAVPAVEDAFYIGHATGKFAKAELNLTTQGSGTWTITWEYWNGAAWTALSGVTDGTSGFTAATGWKAVTFTEPTDWAQNTVDGVLGYWIRGRVSAYTSVTTQPLAGQGRITNSSHVWVDDTTDATDAGAGDVELMPLHPTVGDGVYFGYGEQFCKLKLTTSQARAGTATISLKYWNGSAWTLVPAAEVEDDSAGYSGSPGTHFVHFVPPDDWVANDAANGPNGQTGFFVVMEITALTDMTTQPLLTRSWCLPLKTGASGAQIMTAATKFTVSMAALTKSATNADSVFLLVNCTRGTSQPFTWTKGLAIHTAEVAIKAYLKDQLAIVQVTEDGTTEFADANIMLAGH